MHIAIKENKQLTIQEDQLEAYSKEGYDIYAQDGEGPPELIRHGAGKSVPVARYEELERVTNAARREADELQAALDGLRAEKAALEEELTKALKGKKPKEAPPDPPADAQPAPLAE